MIIRIVGNNLAGGARRYCYLLNNALQSQNFTVKTFIPKAPIADPYSDADLVKLDYTNTRKWLSVGIFIIKHKNEIDYVHLHLRNVAIIFHPLLIILGIPFVITVHAPDSDTHSIKQLIYRKLYKHALIRAKAVIFISKYVLNEISHILKLSPTSENFHVIYNGSEDPHKKRINDENSLSICIVGELTNRKGIPEYNTIIDSILENKLSQKITFNFYGNGPLMSHLEKLKKDTEIRTDLLKINLLGYKTNLDEIFLENDIHLIMSSREAFGRVVTEAMAYGVPSIALKDGAFQELIINNKNGWLVQSAKNAANIILTLNLEKQQISDAANAAYKTFIETFDNEIFTARTIKTLSKSIQ